MPAAKRNASRPTGNFIPVEELEARNLISSGSGRKVNVVVLGRSKTGTDKSAISMRVIRVTGGARPTELPKIIFNGKELDGLTGTGDLDDTIEIAGVDGLEIESTNLSRLLGARASSAKPEPAWAPGRRVMFVIDNLGGVSEVARLLGVSKSQPGRWRDGKETPSPEAARRLVDLEHVLTRALMLWAPDAARVWMRSPNAYLEGATPEDVLATRGSSEVIEALDAAMSGAYS
jgi:hypothetical protein